MIWCLGAIALVASCIFTYGLRHYALSKHLLDIPNERSSHTTPTPRGGGLAFVVVFLCLLVISGCLGIESCDTLIALLGAGMLIATVGFLDDKGHIAARWRLLTHFIAAIWLLYWFMGFPAFPLLGLTLPAWLMTVLVVFYLVWLLNLYNFMDGIDGIASIEAISTGLGMALIYYLTDAYVNSSLILLSLAVAGFLVWNFPPARIFMGDAGSGFLGIMLGAFSVQGAWLSTDFFWSWLILLGVFIVDATWTLVRRLFRGEKLYEAHRRHAYQFAARYFGRHLPVTMAVLIINVVWLLPIAYLVATEHVYGLLGLVIAYIPLIILVTKFKAGTPEENI